MTLKESIKLKFPNKLIPDFFYLLFWKLRDFNCLESSNYVYQDTSKNIHEFRYEICAVLTKNKIGNDLSIYEGTFVTIILKYDLKIKGEYEILIKLEELDHEEGRLPKKIPWKGKFRRLGSVTIDLWMKSILQKMLNVEELSDEHIELVFNNVKNALLETQKIIIEGPKTEYHTAIFFNSYKDFLDYHYKINDYILLPAHSEAEGLKDNHICISKISKEFSLSSSERRNFFELSVIGILFGLITNRHFTLCDYSPRQTQEELGIPNFQTYVEKVSKSKLLEFMSAYPEGELKPLLSREFGYNNIRIPEDAIEIFTKYDNIPPDKKVIFEDSLTCYQLSLDLHEKYPTFSLVSLLSAMEAMTHLDRSTIKQPAKCPLCGYFYNPICPKCGKEYSLEGAHWKHILELDRKSVV